MGREYDHGTSKYLLLPVRNLNVTDWQRLTSTNFILLCTYFPVGSALSLIGPPRGVRAAGVLRVGVLLVVLLSAIRHLRPFTQSTTPHSSTAGQPACHRQRANAGTHCHHLQCAPRRMPVGTAAAYATPPSAAAPPHRVKLAKSANLKASSVERTTDDLPPLTARAGQADQYCINDVRPVLYMSVSAEFIY